MTTKMISFAEIIERVYRGTEYDNIPWSDAAEDVLDVLRLIGVPKSYIDKTTNGQRENPIPIVVENYRGDLPFDMAIPGICRVIKLDTESNITGFTMMTPSQDVFFQSPTLSEQNVSVTENYYGLDGQPVSPIYQTTPMYKLDNNFIYTNFKEGFVEMSYKAYPIDEFGMPMVPDNIKFIKAVEWYLISRMDYKRARITRTPIDMRIYEQSDRECQWYIGAAKSASHIPSVGEMESIKRMILRSIPRINEYHSAFKNTNIQERRKF